MVCETDWMKQETRGKKRITIAIITLKSPTNFKDTAVFEETPVTWYVDFINEI